jgi:hypothetical protein
MFDINISEYKKINGEKAASFAEKSYSSTKFPQMFLIPSLVRGFL